MTTYRITQSAYRITLAVAAGAIPTVVLAIGIAR